MSITLNWNLPAGIVLDNVVIYRGTSALDKNSLPAPLATLAGDVNTYVDDALLSDNVYYYIVSFVKGADVSYSSNYEMGYFSDTGPGPQKLTMGNWTYGYFGELSVGELITAADLKAQLGSNLTFTEPTAWHKFIYKGKILFAPNKQIVYSTWYALYAQGLIFGTDDAGTFPVGASKPAPVNQNKRAIAKGSEFIVRAPRVGDNFDSYLVLGSVDPYCELKQTIGKLAALSTNRPIGQGQYSDALPSEIYTTMPNWTSNGVVAQFTAGENLGTTNNSYGIYWLPILELVR